MTIAKMFSILMFVLALTSCKRTEYILVNSCPPVIQSDWQTTADMYQELVKYQTAYYECVGNEGEK